jgi:hypothetical protein
MRSPTGAIVADECGKKPAPVAAAKAPGKYRATPTHVDGIRFASKTEAGLYEYAKTCGAVVVPHARWPLNCLTSPGFPAVWFTPDLTLFFPVTNTTALGHVVVECWEAKGAKACESRDYALRARAFRRTYPSIPLRVFRKVGGEFIEDAAALAARNNKEV